MVRGRRNLNEREEGGAPQVLYQAFLRSTLILILAFFAVRADAREADCLKEPASFEVIAERYGKEVKEKIYDWFKDWGIEKYPPSYMCKIDESEFLVGVGCCTNLERGSFFIDLNNSHPKDSQDKSGFFDKFLRVVEDKKGSLYLFVSGFSVSEMSEYTMYGLISLNEKEGRRYKSLHDVNDSQVNELCQDGDIKITSRNMNTSYDYRDINFDGYSDIVFYVFEIDCGTKKEIGYMKKYISTNKSFELVDK